MAIKNVFDTIFSMENLYGALEDASSTRRYQADVLKFDYDAWTNLRILRDEIYAGTYDIDRYYIFFIREPKLRMIMSIAFRHRVVQWAIYRVLNPIFVRRYIQDSYGCVPGRGPLKAVTRLRYWLDYVSRKSGHQWYYLKIDISKYFYRISHRVLKNLLKKRIQDERLLNLLFRIIDCKHTPFGLPPGKKPEEVPLDQRLFDVGMPIGNLLSQMFANLYLDVLDQFCKRTLRIRYYVRYMDDIVILWNSKSDLSTWKKEIGSFVEANLELTLNDKTCIRPIEQGIEFVGYRVWPGMTNLRKSTTLRISRSLNGVKHRYERWEIPFSSVFDTFESYRGMLSHTDSQEFIDKIYGMMILQRAEGEDEEKEGPVSVHSPEGGNVCSLSV